MKKNEVGIAFEILLEEIEEVANNLNEQGSTAFKAGNYDLARRAIEEATRLAEFREKVKALQKEWETFAIKKVKKSKRRAKTAGEKLKRGLRTPEDEFREPILETLKELGGKAKMSEVLDIVEEKMKDRLTRYDYEPLPSNPKSLRWKNTAQWCRNTLVREGILKNDSPHGIWELADNK